MVSSLWEFKRLSASVEWPQENQMLVSLRDAASGFLGAEESISSDQLSKTIRWSWSSDVDAMNFFQANGQLAYSVYIDTLQYCQTNKISIKRSMTIDHHN